MIDPEKEFYPPALAMHHSLLIVRPGNPRELLWTWEQVLRCRGWEPALVESIARLKKLFVD